MKEPAIEVLWSAMRSQVTGAVHFEIGQAQEGRRARGGSAAARCARTWRAKRSAGACSTRAGSPRATYGESVRRAKATGKRQGEILIQMGAITEAALHQVLAEQSEDKLIEIFSWTEGRALGADRRARSQPLVRARRLDRAADGHRAACTG